MKNHKLAFPLILLLAAACGGPGVARLGSGGRPAWIEGESPKWPRSQHVLGVGSADDEATAEERARGEISRVFRSDVVANTSSSQTESTQTRDGRTSTFDGTLIANDVKTQSRKELEGTEIVERWRDPASGRRYALAVLGKAKMLQAVDEKTKALDAEAVQWKLRLDEAGGKFDRARAAARLVALLRGRAALDADRRVLGGGSLPSPVDAGAAREAAVRALNALDVVVAVTGDGAEALETGIVSGLAEAGLPAKRGDPGAEGDLVVEAASAVQALAPAGADERWKWSRASATVTLKDGRQARAFARFDASERQASADAHESRRRALSALSKTAAEKVSAAINSYFEE